MLTCAERANLQSILFSGNVDEVISFYETHNIEADYDKGLDGACAIAYMFKGELKTAFEIARNNPKSVGGFYEIMKNTEIEYLIDMGIKDPLDFSKKQSIEDSNEMYPELLKLQSFKGQQRYDYLQMILDKLEDGTLEEQAYNYFLLAEIELLIKQTNRAFQNYLKANLLNPNKALYWGYHAELMNNQNGSPFLSLYFAQQAVKLDPYNAKWRHIKVLALFKLLYSFDKNGYWLIAMSKDQMIKEINAFYKYVRYDQKRLENGMNSLHFPEFIESHINRNGCAVDKTPYVGAHMNHISIFFTKVAGVTFNNRQNLIKRLTIGQQIIPVREPNNRYDSNAIALYAYIDGSVYQIGFVGKDVASKLAQTMDSDNKYVIIKIANITGGGIDYSGVNIQVDVFEKY